MISHGLSWKILKIEGRGHGFHQIITICRF